MSRRVSTDIRSEWASRHQLVNGGTLLQETGEDRALAVLRVQTWRVERPEVISTLLQRLVTVIRDDWIEVEP